MTHRGLLYGCVFGLYVSGLVALASIGVNTSSAGIPGGGSFFARQLAFGGVALIVFMGFAVFDYRIFRTSTVAVLGLYGTALLLLIGLFLFAPEVRGTNTWYVVGPISFNPAEVAKIALIILLAKYFSMRHVELYRGVHVVISGLYALAPAALVAIQPNMGTALVIIAIWLGIVLVSGIRIRHVVILTILALACLLVAWNLVLADYQKERVTSFFFPQEAPLGAGYQQRQATIAVGSGGLFGEGFGQGSQVQHGFLPEARTDFIFAVIAEAFGFTGSIVVIGLFAGLLWSIVQHGVKATNNFVRLYSAGLAAVIALPAVLNIGMNLGLVPVIGVPLPFVSYGGSALVSYGAALGILQSTARRP